MSNNDYILPPCPAEGRLMCFWDATAQGNGEDISYFSTDTSTVYMSVPEGHHVTSVVVSREGAYSPDGKAQFSVHTAQNTVSTPVEAAPDSPAYGIDLTLPIVLVASALVISFSGIIAAYRSRITTR